DRVLCMRRRQFIAGLATAAISSLRARAQQAGRFYRVGSIHLAQWEAPHHRAFRSVLRRLGFVDGYNLSLDKEGRGLRREQFREHATQLVTSGVDAIHCSGDAGIQAAQQATTTIPILGITDDMLAAGLVHSLAYPGANTTGVSIFAKELDGKRQELLLEL